MKNKNKFDYLGVTLSLVNKKKFKKEVKKASYSIMFCYSHPDEGSFYTTYIWKKNIHMFTDHCIWIDMRENIGIYVYVSEGERQRERKSLYVCGERKIWII